MATDISKLSHNTKYVVFSNGDWTSADRYLSNRKYYDKFGKPSVFKGPAQQPSEMNPDQIHDINDWLNKTAKDIAKGMPKAAGMHPGDKVTLLRQVENKRHDGTTETIPLGTEATVVQVAGKILIKMKDGQQFRVNPNLLKQASVSNREVLANFVKEAADESEGFKISVSPDLWQDGVWLAIATDEDGIIDSAKGNSEQEAEANLRKKIS